MADEDALIGHQVGRYQIKEYLREDRLGKVYLAHELPGKKEVDVKVLDPAYAGNDELFARFGREMLATATINHPNTVAMLDFGDHRRLFHYIVLEHVDAYTVEDELAAKKRIEWQRVARIAHQVASALAAAHDEKIIHRNLCPANLLLLKNSDGDFVKIRDFGLSRLVDPQDPAAGGLTAVDVRIGKTEYMSPEYISVRIVHRRGDLYALGVCMYAMLTGAPPYTGKTNDVYDKHLTADIPWVSATVSSVPGWLDNLVYKLLAKDMDGRPNDAREVMKAIEDGMGKPLELPEMTTGTKRKPEAAPPSGLPLQTIAAVAGVIAICLITLAAGLAIGLAFL